MEPNHSSPIDAIQHAVREIVSLHRITVDQLKELIRVQGQTTDQLRGVSEAMREVSTLFREMTGAQGRVNEILTTVANQIERVAEADAAIRQAVVALADQFEHVTGQLVGVNVLLRQIVREQERLALLVLGQEIERHVPTMFCRWLTQLRWGTPGLFYDELQLSSEAAEVWLSARVAVSGTLRYPGRQGPIWLLLWVVPQLDESTLAVTGERIERLRRELSSVVAVLAPIRTEIPAETAIARGTLVLTEEGLRGWEQILGNPGTDESVE
ncbi:hypothetical protein OO015_06595 [Thermomicrobium sp. 4228-Ro]|uniref:hypothetical protein n=1 Tax=Thermomicrobium sp. 4228-Ro TaxID=2993937 RepID=UPI002248D48E|nr:hypothetical protein [Thermomicrobium sp. 4228-Ro]MCX2727165.1 hypothetical protein [Thermomicrobium sp. 4228-Ro]